jgi:TolB-like protein
MSARLGARVANADSAARAAIAMERALDPATIPPGTVAVVPLRVDAADTALADLGYGIADLLLTDLAKSKSVRVVDRVRTDALLHELSVGASAAGPVDSATGLRVGRLLGARRLVVGSLSAGAPRALRLDVRVADAQSGAIDAGLAASTPVDRILDAQKQLAFRVFELLGVALTPAERAAVERRPTGDLSALLAYSHGVRAEAARDFDRAAAEYERAVRADPSFAAARAGLGALRGGAAAGSSVSRAASLAVSGVNAAEASTLRSAADAAVTSAAQIVPITITVTIP